jgi:hypothetical protein
MDIESREDCEICQYVDSIINRIETVLMIYINSLYRNGKSSEITQEKTKEFIRRYCNPKDDELLSLYLGLI